MGRRRFSTLDAMILIAATAVGLGLARAYFRNLLEWQPLFLTVWSFNAIYVLSAGVGLMVAAWSFALLAIHLVPPRPPLRRLVRSPGFAASLAGSVGAGLCLAVAYVDIYIRSNPAPRRTYSYIHLLGLPISAGVAVITAWVMVAAGGGWRRRRGQDWRDRPGLALGWAWMGLYIANILARMLI